MKEPRIADLLRPERLPTESFEAYRIRRQAGNKAVKTFLRGTLTRPSVVFEETERGVFAIPVTYHAIRESVLCGPRLDRVVFKTTGYEAIKHVRAKGVVKVRDREEPREEANASTGDGTPPVDGPQEQPQEGTPGANTDSQVDQQAAGNGAV